MTGLKSVISDVGAVAAGMEIARAAVDSFELIQPVTLWTFSVKKTMKSWACLPVSRS